MVHKQPKTIIYDTINIPEREKLENEAHQKRHAWVLLVLIEFCVVCCMMPPMSQTSLTYLLLCHLYNMHQQIQTERLIDHWYALWCLIFIQWNILIYLKAAKTETDCSQKWTRDGHYNAVRGTLSGQICLHHIWNN